MPVLSSLEMDNGKGVYVILVAKILLPIHSIKKVLKKSTQCIRAACVKIPKISKYTVQGRVNLSFIFKKLTKQVPVNLITGTLIINNIHLIFEGT